MKGAVKVPSHLTVFVGKVVLHWLLKNADLVFIIYRFVWYACKIQEKSSMNSSVDFFENLIDQDGRFAELNCQENTHRGGRVRQRPSLQARDRHAGVLQRPAVPLRLRGLGPARRVAAAAPGHATLDPNWQATKPTIRERNAAMFNNQLMADIRFIVGQPGHTQVIPAHKYVLATGSSVFYAMFFGGLAECKQEIEVPDVEPSAFLTLLKYLYCDEIQLEADTVLSTLYVAKKYIVPHLARACVNFLETSLTAKNACLLLSQSRLFEEPELLQRCWEVIDAQAEMALTSEGFVDIDVSTLESVLARETLNCKEIALFEAALAWAQAECARRDVDPTPQNRRAVLGRTIYLIRFPTMSLEEFANSAAQLGILTPQETIDIFLHFTAATKPHLSYPTKIRTGLKAQICHRFQSCAYRSNQWRYRGRCDSIQFCVDKRIFVVGFGLYGSSNGAADYNVKIELKRLGRVLAENNTKFFSDGSSNTFHVYFENPIQIEPECFYTASAILDGSELSYFGQEGLSEVYMGTVTFQFHCSSESTNGTGVQGGQIPELIYYGPTVTTTSSSTTNED
ncbi:unnamed protein product [Plutella xylostella]|uniref:(diamondback moth) hypothetical protein n=1 Tax=Plutella xylostella TaxID=51655 RepID=A0A8S4DV17_PLUXY|nr:unnamed protein product [Plutella xylostella]